MKVKIIPFPTLGSKDDIDNDIMSIGITLDGSPKVRTFIEVSDDIYIDTSNDGDESTTIVSKTLILGD